MAEKSKYVLADRGSTPWKIIIEKQASDSETHAANELQYFLKEISNVDIAIMDDTTEESEFEILIGKNRRLEKLNIGIHWNEMGKDGFVIRTEGSKLIIAGEKQRGTLYGVYTFLEDYLGCRWFSSKVSRIPKRNFLEIPFINYEKKPLLEYREPHYFDAFDGDWAARNKANGHFHRLEKKHGGKMEYSHFVHTFNSLIPVEEYFHTHPEYFSQVGGDRIREKTQLCLTNPEVLQITIEKVKQWFEENPDAAIVSVSQNDCYNPCQCENCKKVDEMEGSHSGTLIHFVNKVAEAIEVVYPEKIIDTLAYAYTRQAPKYAKPRKNVAVRLCSIECCFSHPLETCFEFNQAFTVKDGSFFLEDIRNWASICDRLYVWDYITDFAHYLLPYPNFQVLKPNIQFMIQNNVKGIFEQGNYSQGGGGEFSELRAYVTAKLLWDPDYNVDLAINEFLTGYYGMAAAPIRAYMDMLREKLLSENVHLNIYTPPDSPYLSDEIIEKAVELFHRAESLADNEEILKRVRHAGLSIRYVQLCNMSKDYPDSQELINKFFKDVKDAGITEIKEWTTLEQSKTIMEANFAREK
jgi:hypothetical protein